MFIYETSFQMLKLAFPALFPAAPAFFLVYHSIPFLIADIRERRRCRSTPQLLKLRKFNWFRIGFNSEGQKCFRTVVLKS